jgi:hypothetical protein
LLPNNPPADRPIADYEELLLKSEKKLNTMLISLSKVVDLIVLDTPSGIGRVTALALRLSDYSLFLMRPGVSAARDAVNALNFFTSIASEISKLRLLGCLFNKFDYESQAHRRSLIEIQRNLPFLFSSLLSTSNKYLPATLENNEGDLDQDFADLAIEILTGMELYSEGIHQSQIIDDLIKVTETVPRYVVTKKGDPSLVVRDFGDMESTNAAEESPSSITLTQNTPIPSFQNEYRSESWTSFLEWTISETNSASAFVMDEQGLLVSEIGTNDVMEQAQAETLRVLDRMGDASEKDFMVFNQGGSFCSLISCRFISESEEVETKVFYICLIGDSPVDRQFRNHILEVLAIVVSE